MSYYGEITASSPKFYFPLNDQYDVILGLTGTLITASLTAVSTSSMPFPHYGVPITGNVLWTNTQAAANCGLTVPASSAWEPEWSSSFSVELLYTSTYNAQAYDFIGKYSTSAPARGWRVYGNGSGKPIFSLVTVSGTTSREFNVTFETDAIYTYKNMLWDHFVFTYNGSGLCSGISCYFNGNRLIAATSLSSGEVTGNLTGTSTLLTSNALLFGSRVSNISATFLSNVSYYDRVLTPTEVMTHWTAIRTATSGVYAGVTSSDVVQRTGQVTPLNIVAQPTSSVIAGVSTVTNNFNQGFN